MGAALDAVMPYVVGVGLVLAYLFLVLLAWREGLFGGDDSHE